MKIAGKRRIEPEWSSQTGALIGSFCIDWVF